MSDLTIILFTISLMLLSAGATLRWQERRDRPRANRLTRTTDE